MISPTKACKCRLVAEAEKIDRSFVSRLLNLTLLAPDIQEAFLDGGQPNVLQLEELKLVMPAIWGSSGSRASGAWRVKPGTVLAVSGMVDFKGL